MKIEKKVDLNNVKEVLEEIAQEVLNRIGSIDKQDIKASLSNCWIS